MKCPKCGYHSFDHLDSCKKCGQGLAEHKEKFNLRGFFSPGQIITAEPEPVVDDGCEVEEPAADGSVDFGFDFLDEEEAPGGQSEEPIPVAEDGQDISIDQPFGADSETIPADDPASESETDSGDKAEKGPEFAF